MKTGRKKTTKKITCKKGCAMKCGKKKSLAIAVAAIVAAGILYYGGIAMQGTAEITQRPAGGVVEEIPTIQALQYHKPESQTPMTESEIVERVMMVESSIEFAQNIMDEALVDLSMLRADLGDVSENASEDVVKDVSEDIIKDDQVIHSAPEDLFGENNMKVAQIWEKIISTGATDDILVQFIEVLENQELSQDEMIAYMEKVITIAMEDKDGHKSVLQKMHDSVEGGKLKGAGIEPGFIDQDFWSQAL